ncbi:MAG: extracellular solute-binding protein, partial [Desulfobacterales bacterium]|nr:extracellular solute-binding protein [Desulfobacterales bacterium]
DLLNPKWQGKIGLWSAAAPFVNLAFELGPDKTRAYLEALKTQKPQIFPSPAALSSAIVSGQIAVGVNAVRFAQTAKADGAPTDGSYPNPVAVTPYYSAIVKAGKNTNTAKLFLSWLLSEPGAAVFEKVTGQGSPHVPGTQASKTFEKLTLSGPPPTGAGGTTAAGYNKEFSAILAR